MSAQVARERGLAAPERLTRASNEDLDVVGRELGALKGWLDAGGDGPVPIRPERLVRRVLDTWSLTAPLTAELLALARQVERAR